MPIAKQQESIASGILNLTNNVDTTNFVLYKEYSIKIEYEKKGSGENGEDTLFVDLKLFLGRIGWVMLCTHTF